jgi:hypothetical protein
MKRAIRWLSAALLLATGVNGLIWLVGLLAAQGLDRAEKILSMVAVPTTIAIGGVGLFPGNNWSMVVKVPPEPQCPENA